MKQKFIILFILLIYPLAGFATTLEEAVEDVAVYFKEASFKLPSNQPLAIQVVNYHNQETDPISTKIEAELYQALEKNFPGVNLVSISASITGINLNKVVIVKGTYEKKGNEIKLRFQTLKGLGGRIIAQTDASYKTEEVVQKALVAVLDIDSPDIKDVQKRVYSDFFRTALSDYSNFNLASSADVDKMDPDAIQKQLGCTRDECATIIGEQLGVDRTISVTLFKLGENNYVLSAKMFDIKNGAILVTKTVEHDAPLKQINKSLRKLAKQLVEESGELRTLAVKQSDTNLTWQITAISLALASAYQSTAEVSKFNDLVKKNKEPISKADFESNQVKMKTYRQNTQIYDMITVLSLSWEGYLFFFSGDDSVAVRESFNTGPKFVFNKNSKNNPQLSLTWNW